MIKLFSVNCGAPMSPTNGFVGNYSHTREGATAAYQCNDGFRPSLEMISVCTNTSLWGPAPEEQNCVLVTGTYWYMYR